MALCCVAALLNTAVWRPTPSLGWFAPVFFLMLLASHAAAPLPKRGSICRQLVCGAAVLVL